MGLKETSRGYLVYATQLWKRFVYFLKPYLRYPLLALHTNITWREDLLKKGSSTVCENPDFHGSTKFMGLLAHVFCLFRPMLLIGLTCLQAQWRLTVVFRGSKQYKKSWRMLSESLQASARLCCALLGNAGRAPDRGFAESSALVDAYTQSGPLYKKWTLVRSPSKHCCRNWSPSRAAGLIQQPLLASLPFTS